MLDFVDLARPVGSVALAILRPLLWFGVEFFVQTLGWGVGWCVCKVVTLGRYPSAGIRDEDTYDLVPRLLVELIGLGVLGMLVWALTVALAT